MALLQYEDSLCGGCGQPKDIAYNPDSAGWFETQQVTCAGCAAHQSHAQAEKTPAPGAKTYVVDTRPPDLELRPWRLGAGADYDPSDDRDDAR